MPTTFNLAIDGATYNIQKKSDTWLYWKTNDEEHFMVHGTVAIGDKVKIAVIIVIIMSQLYYVNIIILEVV